MQQDMALSRNDSEDKDEAVAIVGLQSLEEYISKFFVGRSEH